MADELNLQQVFTQTNDVDLGAAFAGVQVPFQFSESAQRENVKLVSSAMDISPEQARVVVDSHPESLDEAYRVLNEELGHSAMVQGLQRLELAQSPEETLGVLSDIDHAQTRTLNLADLRENTMVKTVEAFDTETARGHIHQNLVISEEIQKASERVWEDASYGELFKDVGQLLVPFTGYAEEEITKWSVDFASEIKRLKATGNRAEAQQVIETFVQALKDAQTPIIERNNTLMTLQALDSLAAEFENGAIGWVDDVVTEEEFRRGVETVAFGAIEATGVGGVADVVKTLAKRILPTRNVSTPAFVPQTDEANIFTVTQREGSSVVDTVAEENGLVVVRDYQGKGLAQTVEETGLETAEAAERLMPSIQEYVNKTYPDPEPVPTVLNELNLVDSVGTVKENLAQRLQKDLGEAGTAQVGDVVLRGNDNPNSLGEFIFHIGDSTGSWFKSQDEAVDVQNRLFGQDSEVVEVNGKYAVKVSHNHTFNPRTDVNADPDTVTGRARMMADVAYTANLVDPLRVLGEDILQGVSSVTDVNTSFAASLAKRFTKATKSWTPAKQGDLGRVLQEAETRGMSDGVLERRDLDYILQSDSKKYVDDIWNSYSDLRDITDELYRVTDRRFRMSLETQGWRNANFGDETDFVRPVRSGETEMNELVYDVSGDRIISQLDLVDNPELSLVRAMNPRVGPDGKDYDLLLVRNNETSGIPAGPVLNKREGYIPRYYTETGWIVKLEDSRKVNGVTKRSSSATHIVRNKRDARAAKAKAVQRGVDEYAQTLDVADEAEKSRLIAEERTRLEQAYTYQRSRENDERDLIWGRDGEVSFGFGNANAKAKGERLLGSEGAAPVLDPVSAISRRINTIQRDLQHPVVASLQAKFHKMYGSVLKDASWNSNLESMLSRSADIDVGTKLSMQSMHSYIESMRQVESAPILGTVDKIVNTLFNDVPLLGKVSGSPLTNTAQWLKKNAATIFIIGRPLFQISTNALQAWSVTARNLVNPAAVARSVASAPFVLAGRINGFDDATALARVLNIPKSEVKPLMDFLFEESGLVKGTDFTDDILSMATEELTTSTASKMGFYARKYGKGALAAPLRVSSKAQKLSLQMLNMYAFLGEVARMNTGGAFKLTAKTKEELLFNTRKLTQTQNRANQFKYQSSADLDGLFFQFFQHVQKMFLDLVVEPVAVATRLKAPIKRNPFADHKATATAVTAVNVSMFGLSGVIGGDASRTAGNEILEKWPEIATDERYRGVYESLRGGLINDAVSGFSDRVTPAAYLDTIHDMFTNTEGVLDMVFGASGGYTSSIYDLGVNLKTLAFTPDMSTQDRVYPAMAEIANLFSGATDLERAYIAYNFGTLPYSRNLSGTAAVNNKEAIAAAFSITPDHILDMYSEMSKRKSGAGGGRFTPSEERINELFVRQMNRELTELQASGEYSLLKAIPIRQKWVGYAKAAHGLNNVEMGKVEDFFRSRTLAPSSEDYEKFIRPYIYDLNLDETLENLERLVNTTDDPRFKEFVEAQVKIRKTFRE